MYTNEFIGGPSSFLLEFSRVSYGNYSLFDLPTYLHKYPVFRASIDIEYSSESIYLQVPVFAFMVNFTQRGCHIKSFSDWDSHIPRIPLFSPQRLTFSKFPLRGISSQRAAFRRSHRNRMYILMSFPSVYKSFFYVFDELFSKIKK